MDQKFWNTLLDRTSTALTQAAHVLGQSASHVYWVLVRQQVVYGIGQIVQVLLSVIVVGIVVNKFSRWGFSRWDDWDEDQEFGYVLCLIFGTIAIGALALGATWLLADGIGHVLNPEFYAIQFIFEQVKPN